MHAQLSDLKKIVCRDFIEALQKCHATGWNRFIGTCNRQKDELNDCLRAERLVRTTKNRNQAKERRTKSDRALQEFHAL